ncbi:MAG: hypothetical protein K2M91_16350 [Lachnospiraceae bacterium]|nr:hypothetical protein [Lachnospiraceae bacterium]
MKKKLVVYLLTAGILLTSCGQAKVNADMSAEKIIETEVDDAMKTGNTSENIIEEEETWTENGDTFTGIRKNGVIDGKGICDYADGGKYEGDWVNGQREGTGTYWFPEDDQYQRLKYEGEWKNDLRHGKGIQEWTFGSRYEGDWVNDQREGTGTHWFSEDDKSLRLKYEGEWKDDMRHGTGRMEWTYGLVYEGDYLNDYRYGKGVLTYPEDDDGNREKYEGNWINSEWYGTGTLLYKDGSKYEGSWINGHRYGTGTFYDSSGNVIQEGQWINNEYQGS